MAQAPSFDENTLMQMFEVLRAEISSLRSERENDRQQFQQSLSHMNQLVHTTQSSTPTPATPPPAPVPTPRVKVNKPKEFTGSRDETSSFLAQCQLVFRSDPSTFSVDSFKTTYALSFLRDDAFKWYEALLRNEVTFDSYHDFTIKFRNAFGTDTSISQDKAYQDLKRLTQTASCQKYSTRFVLLASRLDIDENSKMHQYKHGLKREIQLHVLGLDPAPKTLSSLIKKAVDYDDALYRLGPPGNPRGKSPSNFTAAPTSTSTPMEVDATTLSQSQPRGKLTEDERKRRKDQGLCLYDGLADCGGSSNVNLCKNLLRRSSQGNGPSEYQRVLPHVLQQRGQPQRI